MWLPPTPKNPQSCDSQCTREVRLGLTVHGVTWDRSPLGLSLAGSAGAEETAKPAPPCLLRCLTVRVHTCVRAWVCRGACLCALGWDIALAGWGWAAHLLGLSLQRKAGQHPLSPHTLRLQPLAFQPTPRASTGKVEVSGTLWHWGPPAPTPTTGWLPWPSLHLLLSLPTRPGSTHTPPTLFRSQH